MEHKLESRIIFARNSMVRSKPFVFYRTEILRPLVALVSRSALLAALLLTLGPLLQAQTPAQALQGRVFNGTTKRPVPKAQVNYVMMQRGMDPLATQVTDSEGRFHFENLPASEGAPALLRVEYQGATYSQPVMPQQSGSGGMDIQVYEAAQQPGMVSVTEQAIFFHPTGDTLIVVEQTILKNSSQPPRTYVNPKGTYAFTLPGPTREGLRVSVTGPGGMPINQPPVPRDAENSFAIKYPIRPGETQVRLEYALDYKSPFEFSKLLDVLPERLHVVTPGTGVQVTGDALTALGADPSTGFMGFQVVPKAKMVRLQIRGEAPAELGAGGRESEGESASLVPILDPMTNRRWLILSLTGVVMLAGLIYHYTRP